MDRTSMSVGAKTPQFGEENSVRDRKVDPEEEANNERIKVQIKRYGKQGIFSEMGSLHVEIATKARSLRSSIVQLLRLKDVQKLQQESPDEEIKTDQISDEDLRQLIVDNLGEDIVNSIDGSYAYNKKIEAMKQKLKEKKSKITDLCEQIRSFTERITDYDLKVDLLNQELATRTKQMEEHRDKFYKEYISLHTLVFEKKSDPEQLIPHDAWLRINHFLDLEDHSDKSSNEKTLFDKKFEDAQKAYSEFMGQSLRDKEDIRIEYQKQIDALRIKLHQEQRKKHKTHEEAHEYAKQQDENEQKLNKEIIDLKHSIQAERDMFALKQIEWNKEKELILASAQNMNSLDKEEAQKLRDSFMIAIGSYDDKMSDLQKFLNRKLTEFNNKLISYEDSVHDLVEKEMVHQKYKTDTDKAMAEMKEEVTTVNKLLLEKTENENQLKKTIDQMQAKLIKANKAASAAAKKKEKEKSITSAKESGSNENKEELEKKYEQESKELQIAKQKLENMDMEIKHINAQWRNRLEDELKKKEKEAQEEIQELQNELAFKQAKNLRGGDEIIKLKNEYQILETEVFELRQMKCDYKVILGREIRYKNEINNYGYLELAHIEDEKIKRINSQMEALINVYCSHMEDIENTYSFLDDIKKKITELENDNNNNNQEESQITLHHLKILYNYCVANENDIKVSLYSTTFDKLSNLIQYRDKVVKECKENELMFIEELQSKIYRCNRLKRDDICKTVKRDLPPYPPIYGSQESVNDIDIYRYIEALHDAHIDSHLEQNQRLNERILMLQEDIYSVRKPYDISEDVKTKIDEIVPNNPNEIETSKKIKPKNNRKVQKSFFKYAPGPFKAKTDKRYRRKRLSKIKTDDDSLYRSSVDSIGNENNNNNNSKLVDIPSQFMNKNGGGGSYSNRSSIMSNYSSPYGDNSYNNNNNSSGFNSPNMNGIPENFDEKAAEELYFSSRSSSPKINKNKSNNNKSQSPIASPKEVLAQYLQNNKEIDSYKDELNELIEETNNLDNNLSGEELIIVQKRMKELQSKISSLSADNVGLAQVMCSSPLQSNFLIATDPKMKKYKENKEIVSKLEKEYEELKKEEEEMSKNIDINNGGKATPEEIKKLTEKRKLIEQKRKEINKLESENMTILTSTGGIDPKYLAKSQTNNKKIDEITEKIQQLRNECMNTNDAEELKRKEKEIESYNRMVENLHKENKELHNKVDLIANKLSDQLVNEISNEKEAEEFTKNKKLIAEYEKELKDVESQIELNPGDSKNEERLKKLETIKNSMKKIQSINQNILITAHQSKKQLEDMKNYKQNSRVTMGYKKRQSMLSSTSSTGSANSRSPSQSPSLSPKMSSGGGNNNNYQEEEIEYVADENGGYFTIDVVEEDGSTSSDGNRRIRRAQRVSTLNKMGSLEIGPKLMVKGPVMRQRINSNENDNGNSNNENNNENNMNTIRNNMKRMRRINDYNSGSSGSSGSGKRNVVSSVISTKNNIGNSLLDSMSEILNSESGGSSYKVYNNFESHVSDDLMDNDCYYMEFQPLNCYYLDELEDDEEIRELLGGMKNSESKAYKDLLDFNDGVVIENNKTTKELQVENRKLKDKLSLLKHTLAVALSEKSTAPIIDSPAHRRLKGKNGNRRNSTSVRMRSNSNSVYGSDMNLLNNKRGGRTYKYLEDVDYNNYGIRSFESENGVKKYESRVDELIQQSRSVDSNSIGNNGENGGGSGRLKNGISYINLAENKNHLYLPELPACASTASIKHQDISTPIYSTKTIEEPFVAISTEILNVKSGRLVGNNPISRSVLTPIEGRTTNSSRSGSNNNRYYPYPPPPSQQQQQQQQSSLLLQQQQLLSQQQIQPPRENQPIIPTSLSSSSPSANATTTTISSSIISKYNNNNNNISEIYNQQNIIPNQQQNHHKHQQQTHHSNIKSNYKAKEENSLNNSKEEEEVTEESNNSNNSNSNNNTSPPIVYNDSYNNGENTSIYSYPTPELYINSNDVKLPPKLQSTSPIELHNVRKRYNRKESKLTPITNGLRRLGFSSDVESDCELDFSISKDDKGKPI